MCVWLAYDQAKSLPPFLLPSHTAPLSPESHLFRIFFPWHPFFTFSKIHIQWAWKINGSCGKLATVYICLGWFCGADLDWLSPLCLINTNSLLNFSPMSYCPLVFHIWVMKGSCCNFISIQFQTWWQPLWVCAILWEKSQRSDPGLWANLTWRSSSPLSGSLQIPVQSFFFFPLRTTWAFLTGGNNAPFQSGRLWNFTGEGRSGRYLIPDRTVRTWREQGKGLPASDHPVSWPG